MNNQQNENKTNRPHHVWHLFNPQAVKVGNGRKGAIISGLCCRRPASSVTIGNVQNTLTSRPWAVIGTIGDVQHANVRPVGCAKKIPKMTGLHDRKEKCYRAYTGGRN